MAQYLNEATRVMGVGGAPSIDRTMVAGAIPMDRTMVSSPPAGANATQMGKTTSCSICKTMNSGMEAFCSECGFLLSSPPGEISAEEPSSAPGPELVEASSGRVFRLIAGANSVGRENCDILVLDSTVSRRHATVTLNGPTVTVTDLGSTNGTHVDGVRLSPQQTVPLAPGGTVKFGNSSLTLSGVGVVPSPNTPAEVTVQVGEVPPLVIEPTLMAPVSYEPTILAPSPSSAAIEPGEADTVAEGSSSEGGQEPVGNLPESGLDELDPTSTPHILSPLPPEAPGDRVIALSRLIPVAGTGSEIVIGIGTTTVGRRVGNTVIVTGDPYVSGKHAEIICDNMGTHVVDVGSTNGSSVNGQRLTIGDKQLLYDGDEVTFGQTQYKFETLGPILEPVHDDVDEELQSPSSDHENHLRHSE